MLIPRKILSLEWHISKLKGKEYYSFVRWGDGEIAALTRSHGTAAGHGEYKLSSQLNKAMNQALLKYYQCPEKNLIFSCPDRMLNWMNKQNSSWLEQHKLLGIKWFNCTAFKGASNYGKLFPLIKELRTHKIVIIGPNFLRALREKIFNYLDFIEIDPKRGYLDKTVVPRVLESKKKHGDDIIYSFSTGIGSCIFIPTLHHQMADNFLIDFGSVWDIFCGVRSRHYMKEKCYSQAKFNKNLGIA